jgi:hypothetical protein
MAGTLKDRSQSSAAELPMDGMLNRYGDDGTRVDYARNANPS